MIDESDRAGSKLGRAESGISIGPSSRRSVRGEVEALFHRADKDGNQRIDLEELLAVMEDFVSVDQEAKRTRIERKWLCMGLGLTSALLVLLAIAVFGVSFAAAETSKETFAAGGSLADGAGHVLRTASSTVKLALIAAPALPADRLDSIDQLSVTMRDARMGGLPARVTHRVLRTIRHSDSEVTFELLGGGELRVWQGEAYVIDAQGGRTAVCAADLECAAFTLDDVDGSEEILERALAALPGRGNSSATPEAAGRQLAQANGAECATQDPTQAILDKRAAAMPQTSDLTDPRKLRPKLVRSDAAPRAGAGSLPKSWGPSLCGAKCRRSRTGHASMSIADKSQVYSDVRGGLEGIIGAAQRTDSKDPDVAAKAAIDMFTISMTTLAPFAGPAGPLLAMVGPMASMIFGMFGPGPAEPEPQPLPTAVGNIASAVRTEVWGGVLKTVLQLDSKPLVEASSRHVNRLHKSFNRESLTPVEASWFVNEMVGAFQADCGATGLAAQLGRVAQAIKATHAEMLGVAGGENDPGSMPFGDQCDDTYGAAVETSQNQLGRGEVRNQVRTSIARLDGLVEAYSVGVLNMNLFYNGLVGVINRHNGTVVAGSAVASHGSPATLEDYRSFIESTATICGLDELTEIMSHLQNVVREIRGLCKSFDYTPVNPITEDFVMTDYANYTNFTRKEGSMTLSCPEGIEWQAEGNARTCVSNGFAKQLTPSGSVWLGSIVSTPKVWVNEPWSVTIKTCPADGSSGWSWVQDPRALIQYCDENDNPLTQPRHNAIWDLWVDARVGPIPQTAYACARCKLSFCASTKCPKAPLSLLPKPAYPDVGPGYLPIDLHPFDCPLSPLLGQFSTVTGRDELTPTDCAAVCNALNDDKLKCEGFSWSPVAKTCLLRSAACWKCETGANPKECFSTIDRLDGAKAPAFYARTATPSMRLDQAATSFGDLQELGLESTARGLGLVWWPAECWNLAANTHLGANSEVCAGESCYTQLDSARLQYWWATAGWTGATAQVRAGFGACSFADGISGAEACWLLMGNTYLDLQSSFCDGGVCLYPHHRIRLEGWWPSSVAYEAGGRAAGKNCNFVTGYVCWLALGNAYADLMASFCGGVACSTTDHAVAIAGWWPISVTEPGGGRAEGHRCEAQMLTPTACWNLMGSTNYDLANAFCGGGPCYTTAHAAALEWWWPSSVGQEAGGRVQGRVCADQGLYAKPENCWRALGSAYPDVARALCGDVFCRTREHAFAVAAWWLAWSAMPRTDGSNPYTGGEKCAAMV